MIRLGEKRRLTLEQAARWFLWLRDHDAEPGQVEVFQRWFNSSSRNRRAYEKVESLWQACNGIDACDLPWPTELELAHDQYDGSYAIPLPDNRNPLHGDSLLVNESSSEEFVLGNRPKFRGRWVQNWRMVASISVIAVLLTLAAPTMIDWATGSTPYFSTAVAQQRTEVLQDGSVITLGGATQVAIRFSRDARLVALEKGEAFFQVAQDTQRPFSVLIGDSEVRAIGTAFNINRRDNNITVSVIHGTVDVSRQGGEIDLDAGDVAISQLQQRLEQGQELVISQEGTVRRDNTADVFERAVAWREGRLAYINERLEYVLQDINRYSAQKIVIGDWELGDLRYTGTVFSNDVEAWLKGLERAFTLRTLEVDGRMVLVRENLSEKT